MELREQLRGPYADELKAVDLPNISNLLLYGEPIRVPTATPKPQMNKRDMPTHQTESIIKTDPDKNLQNRSTIPKECKRLAEVDFPIAVVSKHAAREKYAYKGHPNTLHLWWAQATAGRLPGDAARPALARPLRPLLPGGV